MKVIKKVLLIYEPLVTKTLTTTTGKISKSLREFGNQNLVLLSIRVTNNEALYNQLN